MRNPVIVVISLLVASTQAHGTIIDQGTYLSDTVNGQDWLDFSFTLGSSRDQVLSDSSLMSAGWTYASGSQVLALELQFGGTGTDTMGHGPNSNAGLTD